MEVNFKIAKAEDIEGIIQLCNEVFLEDTKLEKALKVFEETKNDPNNIYLIGIINNQIIAHAKITIIHTMYEEMGTYSILNHVCVKPEYRRHNIATMMLNEIENICTNNGCKTMKLWSNNVRVPAHTFYKKYGFILNDAGFFSMRVREKDNAD